MISTSLHHRIPADAAGNTRAHGCVASFRILGYTSSSVFPSNNRPFIITIPTELLFRMSTSGSLMLAWPGATVCGQRCYPKSFASGTINGSVAPTACHATRTGIRRARCPALDSDSHRSPLVAAAPVLPGPRC